MNRVLLSYGASLYVRAVLWFPVRDATAGFKCYRRRVLEKIDLGRIRFTGYSFQIEMKYAAHRYGFRIVEVPIVFVDRVEGVSKMSLKIFREALWGVLQMRLRKWQEGERRRGGAGGVTRGLSSGLRARFGSARPDF